MDFRVGYVSYVRALRRFCRSYGLWLGLVVLTGYSAFLGFMFTLFFIWEEDMAETWSATTVVFLLIAVWVYAPLVWVFVSLQKLNRAMVRLADSEEPPSEEQHEWILLREAYGRPANG